MQKHIKNGLKIEDLRERLTALGVNLSEASLTVEIVSYDHGRDMFGNGTAHFYADLEVTEIKKAGSSRVFRIVESGKRREQVGYSGQNEAALYALDKLGYKLDLGRPSSYDYQGSAIYKVVNI